MFGFMTQDEALFDQTPPDEWLVPGTPEFKTA